jgi:phosphoglycerol transferase
MNRGRLARESLALGAVAFLGALCVLRVWRLDPTVPTLYDWDAVLHLAFIEAMREGSWYLWNARLAAPFGQDVRDFPMGGENLHWAAFKLLGMVMPNAAATATAYLLLTYVLVAVVTYVVARVLRLGTGPAAVIALLYAFLPFHQLRWTMHPLRSGYYPVPLGGLAMLWILDWRRELREAPDGPARWRWSRVMLVVAIGLLLGSSDTQNAFYAAVLILPVAVLVVSRDRDLRPLVLAGTFSVAAGGALVANNIPFLLARAERGPNPDALARMPAEQELYGLRLARLVLPVEEHRVGLFARASAAAERWTPTAPGEAGQALGIVGTVGFFVGLAAVGLAALGRPMLAQAPMPLAALGFLMIVGVLWASVGGFSFLLSLAGLTLYRTWNRMSLWIALFALLAVGAVLQRVLDRLAHRWVATLILGGILVVGLLDQVPAKIRSFDPERLAREWHADAAFFGQVEAALPPGAMVYQAPAMSFPRPGFLRGIAPFDYLKGYLHTTRLRFSYGGMEGRREGTWSAVLEPLGPTAATNLLALVGFDGVLVDHRGYDDEGVAVERGMASAGAVPAVVDHDGSRTLWDLRPVRNRLGGDAESTAEVTRALFNPLRTGFDDNFYDEETDAAGHRWRWASASDAAIRIDTDVTRSVVVAATLGHIDPSAPAVTMTADGTTVTVPVVGGSGELAATLDVPAGGMTLHLVSDGRPQQPSTDPRQLGLLVRDLAVIDRVLLQRLCADGLPGTAPCDVLAAKPAAR